MSDGRFDRVCAFLRERAAWLSYERNNGGAEDLYHASKECLAIESMIRSGRYLEDGRPSWLLNAIKVPEPK